MKYIETLPDQGNFLVLSNASGAGHVQATESMEKAIKAIKPDVTVRIEDFVKLSFGEWIGNYAHSIWNEQQKAENITALNDCLKYYWIHEYILCVIVFFKFLIYIVSNDIDKVITTQPLGITAIIRAVRLINWFRSFREDFKPITVEMVLTELPNENTKNFFYAIQSMYAADRAIFKLIASKPLLKPNETDEDFWLHHTGLSHTNNEVVYDAYPTRKAFHNYTLDKTIEVPSELLVKYDTTTDELDLIQNTCGEKLSTENGKIKFKIRDIDNVAMLMLGGQACINATKQYVQHFIDRFKPNQENETKEKIYLFVFAGKHTTNQNSLLKQIHDIVEEARKNAKLSNRLHIVPLSYQGDTEIAPMMARAVTITKSGGLSSMEINSVARNNIFIHASYDKVNINSTEDELIEHGMPIWEGGNARYLKERRGACIINPATISKYRIFDPIT